MRIQFRIAVQSLRMNRVRTGLTTLGIIIGVASITFVLSLGAGIQQAVDQQVKKLGNNIILVKPGQAAAGRTFSAYNPYNTAITTTLTEDDLQSVRKLPNVEQVAPLMLLSGSLKNQDKTINTAPIVATSPELADILQLKITTGQFIDGQTSRDTTVLGQQLAIDMFGSDQILGQQITIKGRPHTIIGVVKNTYTPINLSGVDLDHTVYISLDDGKSFDQGLAQIQQLNVKLDQPGSISKSVRDINKSLLGNHDGEQDFSVLGAADIAKSADSFFTDIVMITTVVAAIALVVGGIGIMNIMLVSVIERTREIGIRKALGATNQHIMSQFLIESLLMSIVGGIIGLVIAYGLAFLIGAQLSFQPAFNWQVITIGFGLATGVGIVFGLYPAIKASRKNPIESLRQDI